MVLAGKRCRSGSASADPIKVISGGVRLLVALVLLADMRCARRNPGMGVRWIIGQDTVGVTVVQGEPCRIMACYPGWAAPAAAERAVGTSGRRYR